MIHSGSQAVTGEVSVITTVSFMLSSGAPLKHSEPHGGLMNLMEGKPKSCSCLISQ